MRILGIDTATPAASVALVDDGRLVAEEIQYPPVRPNDSASPQPLGNHAEVVLPLIEALLARTQVSIQQVAGIAVSIGPGSFTGLRIGLATAKGIAYDSGLPLVGVSTLHANASRVSKFDGVIVSVLDARKGEVYFALFRREKASITRLTPDSVMSIDSAVNLVRETCTNRSEELLLIGDGTKAHGRRLVDAVGLPPRTAGGVCYPSIASQVAMLATPRFTNASGDDGGALTPVYLRLAEAESKRKIQASF